MTPCERVEAIARAAWGVSRVDVTVAVLPSHAVAVVSSEQTSDSVPRSQTATAPTVAAALLRAADLIAGGVSNSATEAQRVADNAAAEARILARLAAHVARAAPCREHVARCHSSSSCAWERCPRVLPHLSPHATQMRPAAHPSRWVIAALRAQGQTSDALQWPALRPLWWRRGRKGRACRDPRKRAPTCKVMP